LILAFHLFQFNEFSHQFVGFGSLAIIEMALVDLEIVVLAIVHQWGTTILLHIFLKFDYAKILLITTA
jgi:hypothetical protein